MNSTLVLATLAILTAVQDPKPKALPRVESSPSELAAHLHESVVVRFQREAFSVLVAEIAGATLAARTPGAKELLLNGESAHATAQEWLVTDDTIVIDVSVEHGDAALDLRQTLSAVQLGSVRGYRRDTAIVRPEDWSGLREGETSHLLWFADATLEDARRASPAVDHYGYSTVSDPGTTYEIRTFETEESVRVWLFRSGIHFMNQALNPGIEPRLREIVLVDTADGEEDRFDLGDVIAAFVEEPHDRRALLAKHAPKRFAKEYGGDPSDR